MRLPSRRKQSGANLTKAIFARTPFGRTRQKPGFTAPFSLHDAGCAADLRPIGMLTLEKLAELLEKHHEAAKARVKEFSIGGRHFDFNSCPAIMGVINLSPDSWYRESVCL